mmetsp:Transcript_6532/g.13581  ORF Transcript_6532/g.13581 Transcript_6532/m.13581 type:complete len:335 (-) Transcript_6532:613-1617(-)
MLLLSGELGEGERRPHRGLYLRGSQGSHGSRSRSTAPVLSPAALHPSLLASLRVGVPRLPGGRGGGGDGGGVLEVVEVRLRPVWPLPAKELLAGLHVAVLSGAHVDCPGERVLARVPPRGGANRPGPLGSEAAGEVKGRSGDWLELCTSRHVGPGQPKDLGVGVELPREREYSELVGARADYVDAAWLVPPLRILEFLGSIQVQNEPLKDLARLFRAVLEAALPGAADGTEARVLDAGVHVRAPGIRLLNGHRRDGGVGGGGEGEGEGGGRGEVGSRRLAHRHGCGEARRFGGGQPSAASSECGSGAACRGDRRRGVGEAVEASCAKASGLLSH